jgi:hypothetical protein|tara:strand:+ start:1946 stop:2131 length:186 start_codon:yes stop_codon:yes gene_type:complete
MEYNKDSVSETECLDNIIFLKDLRGQIPHDFMMSEDLKRADRLIVSEIKFWEAKILDTSKQ